MKLSLMPQLKVRLYLPLARLFVLLGAFALLLIAAPALAQSTPEPTTADAAADGSAAADTSEITPDQVNEVARTLWCPLCSGVRLDSCELKACDQMRDEIAIMLAEGQDRDAIRARFIELYGPQVLGEPPREGWNWLAWLLPFVALVAGGGFLWSRARQMVRPSDSAPAEREPLDGDAPDANAVAERDEYEQKLDDELARYS